MAQSGELPTLHLGLNYDLTVMGSSPTSDSTLSLECAWVSFPLPPLPPYTLPPCAHMHTHSLSLHSLPKTNKNNLKEKKGGTCVTV